MDCYGVQMETSTSKKITKDWFYNRAVREGADNIKRMVSLGEIDKKGFRYSMGETHAEINERVSKLEQKYTGIIEGGDCQ